MATTLVQYWTHERDVSAAAQQGALVALSAAHTTLSARKADLDADSQSLAKLGTAIAANRAKLATTAVPSDVQALTLVVRDQIIAQRTLQGTILDDQEAVALAQADADSADATGQRAAAAHAAALTALVAATDEGARRHALRLTLAAAPFTTIVADATAFAASVVATDAQALIDANFPSDLQTIARKREKTRNDRVLQLRHSKRAAISALGAALASTTGAAGLADQRRQAFDDAADALRVYADSASQHYAYAVRVMTDLQSIKNGTKTPDLLSAQEHTDITVNAARTTAATNGATVDADRNALYTALNDLDTQIVTQIGTDVEALATDPTILAKNVAITNARSTLAGAGSTMIGSGDRKVLDEWEVIAPDRAWLTLLAFLDAKATLVELQGIDPASLGPALDAAEDAYAIALAAASKAQRQADALTDAITIRSARLDAATAAAPGRLLSAVRGDSF